ncbi:unnamed protein product, partial [Prorocentrum cordatum]
ARWSADNAIARLSQELSRFCDSMEAAEMVLRSVVGSDEVAPRLQALLPTRQAKLAGREPSWLEALRRNAALHADAQGISVATARLVVQEGRLRAEAPVFIPSVVTVAAPRFEDAAATEALADLE